MRRSIPGRRTQTRSVSMRYPRRSRVDSWSTEQDKQGCEEPSCQTLKQGGQFQAEVVGGPCDSEPSKALDGTLEGSFVAAYKDGDTTNRGGQTGKLKWQGAGAALVGRMRGIVNAGTHYPPVGECEKCYTLESRRGVAARCRGGGKPPGLPRLRLVYPEARHQRWIRGHPRGPAHLPVQVIGAADVGVPPPSQRARPVASPRPAFRVLSARSRSDLYSSDSVSPPDFSCIALNTR